MINFQINNKVEVILMSKALKEMDKVDLVNLERLAYILKGLSRAELETLEILLDDKASMTLLESIKELNEGRRIPLHEW